ncbi:hypothetical protein Nepgr_031264 [Nepenthes gracilis]|uniref:Cytochrome P450 n=1 Tax=Nepenthes gracilis TaxID=150966 RepID=A0AAD3TI59_NEPGR|nr:hypothetical protein Nepgr_031264 [Nepenthes gracilis]
MALFLLSSFLLLSFFLSLYRILQYSLSRSKTKPTTATVAGKTNHGFKRYPFFGSIPQYLANRDRFMEWTTGVLSSLPGNTAIFYSIGSSHCVVTANPSNVEHILKTNFHNYPKGGITIPLEDFLGRGIFNADGPQWMLQRKIASYVFNRRSLRDFVLENVRNEIQTRLVPLLKAAAETGRVLDLQDVLERFAFDNVCKVAFNVDPRCLGVDGPGKSGFMRAFQDASTIITGRVMDGFPYVWNIKKFFNVGSEKKLRESIQIVRGFVDGIIRKRLEEKSEGYEDLLSRFIGAGENSLDLLRDVAVSFILAGSDTTSSGLSWLFWQLSLHPNVVDNIRLEAEAIRARRGKRAGDMYDIDELREMNYMHAAISEALRLYPPVPTDIKACLEDDVLPDGTVIKKGWFIYYHSYAMGRMASVWGKDCEMFRPERWMENGKCRQESAFRYPVFHAGPRICLGKEMAYIQMKATVMCLIEQFKVEMLEKEKTPRYLQSLTLRMKDGLRVRVKERNV